MSKTLLRNMLNAGINADLSKNEWRVFAAMMIQTLGYGKRRDPLTNKRIASIAGIRADRIKPHIKTVVDAGLFESSEHKWLDATYCVPERFFDGDVTERFFAPSTPKTGYATQAMVDAPQNTGDEHQVLGTYRDRPLQSYNPTEYQNTNNIADSAENESHAESRAVNVVCHLTMQDKPKEVDPVAFEQLKPQLSKLPTAKANNVLELLALAVRNGSITTSQTALGGGLIKAAKAGTLDIAPLQKAAEAKAAEQKRQIAAIQSEMNGLKRESAGIRALFERSGIPLPAHEIAQLAMMQAQYQALKNQLSEMQQCD